jgi:hypothetical protein
VLDAGVFKTICKGNDFLNYMIYQQTIKYGINFYDTKINHVRPVEIALTIFIR